MTVLRLLLGVLLAGAAQAVPVYLVDGAGARVSVDGELRTAAGAIAVRSGIADVPVDEKGVVDVRLVASGWWALPATVTAAGTRMRVWPTGFVRGRSIATKGIPSPASVTVVVESPPQPVQPPAVPRGTRFDCEAGADGRFLCELPAETLDLVFRSKGLTPHYRWGVVVGAGRVVDVGTLKWAPGASLVVWLDRESARAALVAKGARATLTRMVSGSPSSTASRLAVPVAEATFDRRGYAQLAPVSAGMYSLEVSAAGFASSRISPIEIFEGSESVLRKPVVLDPPIVIAIAITPPLDIGGERWAVTFSRLPEAGAPMIAHSRNMRADELGRLVVDGESPGRFNVSIADSNGNRVAAREFLVTSPADANQMIAIDQHVVGGRVTLGGDPLPAEVIFGTRTGSERVTLEAGEDGEFRGVLPRLGQWPVEIRNEARQVSALRLEQVLEDEALEIRLGNGQIAGSVVDELGQPVPKAQVFLVAGPLTQSHVAGDSGEFLFLGVDGAVALSARSPRSNDESSLVSIDVTGGKRISDVKLQLHGRRDVSGRVICEGQPLPGAFVSVHPGAGGRVMRATTDLSGQFQVTLRADEKMATFVAAAAGRTMAAFRLPITKDPLTLTLDSVGGEVVVRFPADSDRVLLDQNGARISIQELSEWSAAHGRELISNGDTLTVPDLARGVVRACAHVAGRGEICKEALLVPRASVTIELR